MERAREAATSAPPPPPGSSSPPHTAPVALGVPSVPPTRPSARLSPLISIPMVYSCRTRGRFTSACAFLSENLCVSSAFPVPRGHACTRTRIRVQRYRFVYVQLRSQPCARLFLTLMRTYGGISRTVCRIILRMQNNRVNPEVVSLTRCTAISGWPKKDAERKRRWSIRGPPTGRPCVAHRNGVETVQPAGLLQHLAGRFVPENLVKFGSSRLFERCDRCAADRSWR